MHYITAAFNNPEYKRYVKGLIKSFTTYCNDKLTVYTDLDIEESCGIIVKKIHVDDYVNNLARIHPQTNSRIKFSWAKVYLLYEYIKEYECPTCWIDADMLIMDNLKRYLLDDLINIISYGFGDNIRDCGDNIKIKQSNYAVGSIFSFPDLKTIKEFYLECLNPIKILGDLNEQSVCEQSALNRFLHKHKGDIHCVDEANTDTIFNLEPWMGHITQQSNIKDMLYHNGWTLYNKNIAILYFMSHLLPQFINSKFYCINDNKTRKRLISFYE